MTLKKKHIHVDPQRFPKLQEPIENAMYKSFKKGMDTMLVDVTKILVNQVKEKKNGI